MTQEPLFNGTSCVALYAATGPLFKDTVNFYRDILGFSVVSEDSQSTCLAVNHGLESSAVVVTLDTAKAESPSQISDNIDNFARHAVSRDWRTLLGNVSFKTNDIRGLTDSLSAAGCLVQLKPDDLDPFELYTVDPLGTLVGFSALQNPFGVAKPPGQKPVEVSTPLGTPGAATPARVVDSVSRAGIQRNIAVMTSGGDAPGMNANVRAVIRTAIFRGSRAFAIYEGYTGLVRGGPEYIREMHWHDVRGWLAEGGTNIGTARCKEFRERAGRLQACFNLISAGIDALVVCGGDGSLTGADLFRAEWPSLVEELASSGKISADQATQYATLNICGTVGSIDNDMASTDATIGAYSSLARICQAIDYIDATANSHQRAFVVEVMGRHCGWLALMAGIATNADYIFIPEKPASKKDWEDHMCGIVGKHRKRGKRKTIVIVAEGAISNDLKPITCKDVLKVLVDRLGLDTRITTLGHVQRGGTAVAYDRILATRQGVAAVDAVLAGNADTPSPMIAVAENKIVSRPLVDAVRLTKQVAEAIENRDFAKAISLRDAEFNEHLHNFMAINSADHGEPTLPVEKRKRIAIVNVGAPAGGMNSAVHAMACYCMSRGHTPYAIHNGFSGLARHESVRSISWLDIEGWNSLGGSEIGTNRCVPEDTDIGMVAYYLEKYRFDGLILVGGFEAFVSLSQLEHARAAYPAFRIPMVLIPATISNNVPGTEYSLGSDTCLNSLVDYCDVIKQSAAATRNRVFVVEVQGGNSGYIASFAQLASGATASYVPEEGISLTQLEHDIASLRESFANDNGKTKSGRLILKSANSSKVLTTQVIADIINQESRKRFDAKTAVPGHVQQGGLPSPIDRTRAARFAVRAVQFIEDNTELMSGIRDTWEPVETLSRPEVTATAAVLGVERSHLRFTPVRRLYDFESNQGKRVRKKIFWDEVREIGDMLVGRSKAA
ncbi:unnamed protein product [Kuraishia capsulata CBS 1993]|uniref:ATP-dependent 6-phosphofructokinase n=1 Tax=Kuraishia capsulata CBS 1993 TaxID=1382522 RepID=W6MKS6_9ASCO|nr:uncharacterized protein KUCA_T00002616001 [Kuraishia capsulata CBS 1993]CDK26643.1 unnamed protein product [Kuraishia capsulata CBS 1993]